MSIRNVALERLTSRRQEIRIIASPDRDRGRFVCPEILLESGIEGRVARIVEDEVELHVVSVGARKI